MSVQAARGKISHAAACIALEREALYVTNAMPIQLRCAGRSGQAGAIGPHVGILNGIIQPIASVPVPLPDPMPAAHALRQRLSPSSLLCYPHVCLQD